MAVSERMALVFEVNFIRIGQFLVKLLMVLMEVAFLVGALPRVGAMPREIEYCVVRAVSSSVAVSVESTYTYPLTPQY